MSDESRDIANAALLLDQDIDRRIALALVRLLNPSNVTYELTRLDQAFQSKDAARISNAVSDNIVHGLQWSGMFNSVVKQTIKNSL